MAHKIIKIYISGSQNKCSLLYTLYFQLEENYEYHRNSFEHLCTDVIFILSTGSYLKTGKIPNRQRSASNDKINGDDASISKAAEVHETFHFIFGHTFRF